MIDDNGVHDISHVDVFEGDVRSHGLQRRRPRLDPDAVLSPVEGGVPDGDAVDLLLGVAAAEAADADAVAGAAPDAGDEDVLASGDHADAVVAGADDGVDDVDVSGGADVDAVGVGAVRRRVDADVAEGDGVTGEEAEVGVLAVE